MPILPYSEHFWKFSLCSRHNVMFVVHFKYVAKNNLKDAKK